MVLKGLGFVRHNIIGLLALFVALGGTTYAATQGSHASSRTIHACAGRNGALKLAKHCAKGERSVTWNVTGPAGAPGAAGAAGQPGTNAASKVVVRSTTVADPSGGVVEGSVQCDTGEKATGGGWGRGYLQPTTSNERQGRSFPLDAAGHEATGGETPTGWDVVADGGGLTSSIRVYVVCVSP